MTCEGWSFSLVCPSCQKRYCTPNPTTRLLPSGLYITSFFSYHDIAPLLHTKHTPIGHPIFSLLAHHSFKKLASSYQGEPLFALPIDDHTHHGYSHTAILAHALQSPLITPLFGSLRAQSPLHYSGQSLTFRKENPRRFRYKAQTSKKIILVDDIVTTGTTLLEAYQTILSAGGEVIGAFVLADASRE